MRVPVGVPVGIGVIVEVNKAILVRLADVRDRVRLAAVFKASAVSVCDSGETVWVRKILVEAADSAVKVAALVFISAKACSVSCASIAD